MMTQQQQLQRCTSSATMWVLLLLIILQTISSLLLCQSFQQQPFLSPPVSPTFEQRMREQLEQRQLERRVKKRQQQQQPSKKSSSSTETKERKTTLISNVRNLEDYKHVLEQASEEEQMVAVFWYAPWCTACKAALPGLKSIAKQHPNIKFIQVPVVEENSILHQGLQVPSVPYMHVYTPDVPRLVEERTLTRKNLSGFQKLLKDYEEGSCALDRMMNNEWSTSNPYSFPSSNSNIPSTTINTRAKNMMGKVGFVTP
mmetsp:Transcript_47817/g.51680  ORF Transcript_47817/g.51680 Transcript_47817/m.51680 type:complete len:257 (+) Transcript_47817:71-841(+)